MPGVRRRVHPLTDPSLGHAACCRTCPPRLLPPPRRLGYRLRAHRTWAHLLRRRDAGDTVGLMAVRRAVCWRRSRPGRAAWGRCRVVSGPVRAPRDASVPLRGDALDFQQGVEGVLAFALGGAGERDVFPVPDPTLPDGDRTWVDAFGHRERCVQVVEFAVHRDGVEVQRVDVGHGGGHGGGRRSAEENFACGCKPWPAPSWSWTRSPTAPSASVEPDGSPGRGCRGVLVGVVGLHRAR